MTLPLPLMLILLVIRGSPVGPLTTEVTVRRLNVLLRGSTILSAPRPRLQKPPAVVSVLAAVIARASVHWPPTKMVAADAEDCPSASSNSKSAAPASERFQFLCSPDPIFRENVSDFSW